MIGSTTFAQFVIEEQRRAPEATGDLSALLHDVCTAVKAISAAVGRGEAGARRDATGDATLRGADEVKLAELASEIVLRACRWGGHLAGIVSAELLDVYRIPEPHPRGKYLLAFHPLDGAGTLDVNAPAGTIFSILRRPGGAGDAARQDFLQPGSEQVCAGYALYGPCTMLVVSLGRGVHGFTLDRELGDFVLTHPDLRVADTGRSLAVNPANERFWEPPVKRYVEECLAGGAGPRECDFDVRWVASLVTEVHRLLVRGGVYMCPREAKGPPRAGRLRLLHEAAPMAFLVEQAGGLASTGRERLLELTPSELHQRTPVILGSRPEVERLVRYHDEHARGLDRPFSSPLFATRSLLVEP
ncbi:MAG TPA: class 1 fructose-bisphosphatase [Anaeromyxobacteraceae bacterium]|nr:class 1 fructose-bisphosphatase [Anaeromyxobacteraceae bacterium]